MATLEELRCLHRFSIAVENYNLRFFLLDVIKNWSHFLFQFSPCSELPKASTSPSRPLHEAYSSRKSAAPSHRPDFRYVRRDCRDPSRLGERRDGRNVLADVRHFNALSSSVRSERRFHDDASCGCCVGVRRPRGARSAEQHPRRALHPSLPRHGVYRGHVEVLHHLRGRRRRRRYPALARGEH